MLPEPEEVEVVAGELVPVATAPATLFRSDDPRLIVARAVEVADELARVIRDRNLAVRISGKEHVLVGGWTLLGTMLGVFPVTVWTRKLEDGWEARVEARTLDGRVVGAAESECLRSERRWARADDYALRSMAATRATSKALRLPLGFVMELAGFDATPADEIPGDVAAGDSDSPGKIPAEDQPTEEQKTVIRELYAQLAYVSPDVDWRARARQIAGCSGDVLTTTLAKRVIEKLEAELASRQQPAA